jgi:hypothetical protein
MSTARKTSEMVTLQLLSTMWKELVIDSFCKEESELMCRWLQELTDKEKEDDFFTVIE